MTTFFGTMFLVVIVTVMGLAVFGFWAVGLMFRAIFQGMRWALGMPVKAPLRRPGQPKELARVCPNSRCMQWNPKTAQYCRRCGRPIAAGAMRVSGRVPGGGGFYGGRAAPPPGWA